MPAKRVFLPGATTAGHYQIELSCRACHTESFSDDDALQKACEGCHGAELEASRDSHPRDKFTDPRNADRTSRLDARRCTTCHGEHRPELTSGMGVTVPEDYCFRCHENIADERPSHQGMAFDSCDDAGCHNFHDNRSLYEDFLAKHAGEPDHKKTAVLGVSLSAAAPATAGVHLEGAEHELAGAALSDWDLSAHRAGGVQCEGCHANEDGNWTDAVSHQACRKCHSSQVSGFLEGRHGMRLNQNLAAMTVGEARAQMAPAASHRELTCNSCHPAHRYDTKAAAVDACLGCHADDHSRAFTSSEHFALFQSEQSGAGIPGSGVSCATCHLPRQERELPTKAGGSRTLVVANHNQNASLRPNEKMLRPVCVHCHGLGFAINALADPALIASNFDGAPGVRVSSIELALNRTSKGTKKAATRNISH